MDTLSEPFADHLEADILQFETNANLWRLEVGRHAHRILEERAVGLYVATEQADANVALEGVVFEIDRLQAFARQHPGIPDVSVLRLAEAGLLLETGRRKLVKALSPEPS